MADTEREFIAELRDFIKSKGEGGPGCVRAFIEWLCESQNDLILYDLTDDARYSKKPLSHCDRKILSILEADSADPGRVLEFYLKDSEELADSMEKKLDKIEKDRKCD